MTTTTTKGRDLVQRLGAEVKLYGGLPLRRRDVYVLALEDFGDHPDAHRGADYHAFAGEAIDAEPFTIDEARAVFAGGPRMAPPQLRIACSDVPGGRR